MSAYSV